MKRSEHFNVVAGKWLNGYSLLVNGRKYAISGVGSDNKLVLHCLDANDIVCEYSDLSLGSSHIFVNGCDHVICDVGRVFVDGKSHHGLYVVDKGDEWRSYWVEGSYVFYCSDEPVSVLANWKIGTYGFAENKFPFIVPFHKFNPDNIGKSLQYNVIKQQ